MLCSVCNRPVIRTGTRGPVPKRHPECSKMLSLWYAFVSASLSVPMQHATDEQTRFWRSELWGHANVLLNCRPHNSNKEDV